MNAINAIEELRQYPVFDIRKVQNVIDKGPEYARLFVHRLKVRGLLQAVERNKYTLHNDPLVVAPYLVWPSYVSCQTALRYHNLTEQIVHDITIVTTKPKKDVRFNNATVRFIKAKPKYLFGFERKKYDGFAIPVAEPEKALLDTALHKQLSLSEVKDIMREHVKELNTQKIVSYIIRIGNASLARRMGFLLERLGYDCYPRLKKYVNHNYIRLDYTMPLRGKNNKKWGLTANIKV